MSHADSQSKTNSAEPTAEARPTVGAAPTHPPAALADAPVDQDDRASVAVEPALVAVKEPGRRERRRKIGASRILAPEGTTPPRVNWEYAAALVVYHALALLALHVYFFSWTGVALAVAGLYVFGTLGINLCYHRLLTHSGLQCPKWLEHVFATLGVCCLQDTPARWVAVHRMHHQYSDERPDPHSPLVNFLWGHMGWLLIDNRDHEKVLLYDRYARDIVRDPFYRRFEHRGFWALVVAAHVAAFFVLGVLAGLALFGPAAAVQFGLSVLIWGVFVRTVAVWHITWSVNSVAHIWGYRNYETDENSRNNWLVALWSNGEGWHNNHHADQRSAAHGHKWWEFDVTWRTIRFLQAIGLAKAVVYPRRPDRSENGLPAE